MQDKKNNLINYLLFLLVTLLLVALQCSLWSQYLGNFPSPHFWIPTLAYWSIYRQPKEGLIMAYLIATLISPFTATPLSYLAIICLVMFLTGWFLKVKFFQSGPIYFSFVCAILAASFVPLHFVITFALENHLMTNIQYFQWVLKTLLTVLAAIPMLGLFITFDNMTHKALPTEIGRSII